MKKETKFRLKHGLVFGATLILGAFCLSQDKKPEKVPTAGQRYKNIKILKDLPADQLIPVMHNINQSLGVRCDYCHVINAEHTGFELDTKPMKKTARNMMIMVKDIYKHEKIVSGKISCYTCHHGKTKPDFLPPDDGRGPRGPGELPRAPQKPNR